MAFTKLNIYAHLLQVPEPNNAIDPRDDEANRSPDFNGFGEQNVEASEFSLTEGNPSNDSGFVGNTDGSAEVSASDGSLDEHDPLVPIMKQEQPMQMLAITDVVGSSEVEMLDLSMLGTPDPEIII